VQCGSMYKIGWPSGFQNGSASVQEPGIAEIMSVECVKQNTRGREMMERQMGRNGRPLELEYQYSSGTHGEPGILLGRLFLYSRLSASDFRYVENSRKRGLRLFLADYKTIPPFPPAAYCSAIP
jgi:hypothetical protein